MYLIRVLFRTILCSMLPLCLLCGSLSVSAYTGSARQNKTAGTNLRVMSYNVLMDNGEGGISWGRPMDSLLDGNTGHRPDGAVACIQHYAPDVVMFQEFSYNWYQSVRAGLPDYVFVNTRDEGKDDYMCTALMYNTKTLRLVDTDLVGYHNTRWGKQRMRYMNVGVFEIIATGEQFMAISTHLDSGKAEGDGLNRPAQAKQMAAQLNAYKQEFGCPIIAAGDYNSTAKDVPISTITKEAQMAVANDGGRDSIDYILMSKGVSCSYYTTLTDADVAPSSDHLPVMADFVVQKYQFPTMTTTTEATTTTTVYDPIVIQKNTTTAVENDSAQPTEGLDVEETTTTKAEGNKDKQDTTVEKTESPALTALPVWALALLGFGGTALLGGLAFLIVMLATRNK